MRMGLVGGGVQAGGVKQIRNDFWVFDYILYTIACIYQ